jgi:hypothetical protein
MAGMLVLTTVQPIAGVDMHYSLPPIPPAILPHVVVWGTGLSLGMGLPSVTASHAMSTDHPTYMAKPIGVGVGHACGRAHDAGTHLGHIAGNTLLPIIFLGSSSKAEFGSGTVLVQGEHMAVNLMCYVNLQLDCNDPIPMPTGVSIALGSNMVYANFTAMDALNGFVHMLVDVAIVAILNFVLAGLGSVLGRVLKGTGMTGLLSDMAGNARGVVNDLEDIFVRKLSSGKRAIDWSRLTPRGFAQQFAHLARNHWTNAASYNTQIAPQVLGKAAKSAVPGVLTGSPTGISASSTYSPGARGASAADSAVDSIFY